MTNISVDLEGDEPLDEASAPFHLRATPEAAAGRLRRLADLGFDDAVVVHRGPGEPDLAAIRCGCWTELTASTAPLGVWRTVLPGAMAGKP